MPVPRVVCFGEILVRLSAPDRELMFQSPRLNTCFGGAEANVATGLAYLGYRAAMVSAVPNNTLGRAAIAALRGHGVDTAHIVAATTGRMGLYFLTPGAGLRSSDVIYDREGSAFAAGVDIDWPDILAGAEWLHLSGITPALGALSAQAALGAVHAASAAGVKVSFDGNYRARLWEAWNGDPRAILTEIIHHVDLLFGNHRDVALLLGKSFEGDGPPRRREAALAAFDTFPNLVIIASTERHVDDVDHHRISARIDTREGNWTTDQVAVSGVVDRIGTGDAFVAGVLHALLTSAGEAEAARSGLAMSCLKHSLPGDSARFTTADLAKYAEGNFDVRR